MSALTVMEICQVLHAAIFRQRAMGRVCAQIWDELYAGMFMVDIEGYRQAQRLKKRTLVAVTRVPSIISLQLDRLIRNRVLRLLFEDFEQQVPKPQQDFCPIQQPVMPATSNMLRTDSGGFRRVGGLF